MTGVHRSHVTIPAGASRPYDEQEWTGALVVVVQGVVQLEGTSGTRYPFPAGALLWLAGIPLRALHSTGSTPAVLLVVRAGG